MDHLLPSTAHFSPLPLSTPQPTSASSSSSTPPPSPAPLPSSIALSAGLVLRRLQRSDFSRGFLTLLAQLTDVGDVSEERFGVRFDEISRTGDAQQVWVIEDVERGVVCACATLLLELKFIHDLSKIAHIEDVVVSGGYRGKSLGFQSPHSTAQHSTQHTHSSSSQLSSPSLCAVGVRWVG